MKVIFRRAFEGKRRNAAERTKWGVPGGPILWIYKQINVREGLEVSGMAASLFLPSSP